LKGRCVVSEARSGWKKVLTQVPPEVWVLVKRRSAQEGVSPCEGVARALGEWAAAGLRYEEVERAGGGGGWSAKAGAGELF
jgi:hypothetical protein